MEAGGVSRSFDRLRVHSIGLPQVLFQSITHMAPAAAVAYSIYISVPDARQALPLSVALALIACICAATAIGQLAKLWPSAGGMYTYVARSLGPGWGFLVAWLFIGFEPLVAPFLYLEFGWAMSEVFTNSVGWHYSGQWWIWVVLMTVIVFLLTYRDIRLSTTAGVILGTFEIAIFGALALWMIFSNAGDLNVQTFNPHHAAGDWSGVFKGMVFAILAFIGFATAFSFGFVIYRLPLLRSRGELDSWLSREFAFLVNNWVLLGAAFFILVATLFPTLSEAVKEAALAVDKRQIHA